MSDFANSDFNMLGEIHLSEWVINGDHYPNVKIYHNNVTNECYQVSERHKKFRKTPPSSDQFVVQQYGKWEDLE